MTGILAAAVKDTSRGGVNGLGIAIVTYAPDLPVLTETLDRLGQALAHARRQNRLADARLILVDNGPGPTWKNSLQPILDAAALPATVELLSGHGNIGYGAAHNLALSRHDLEFHLILNPDALLDEDALSEGLAFLAAHPEAGLLAPAVWGPDGQRQYLCKAYPTALDLALRGFAPIWLKRLFRARLEHYELRDRIGETVYWDPPLISGCFMLARRDPLVRAKGFHRDYFLYFEDYDLSLRLAEHARLVFVPAVRIVHLGGHAARKGFRHIFLFLCSAASFFNRHGWRWW
ncbi:MAG TPA: glycosyltransferase family 2 protein [Candidatus Competibacter sp.]|nr:glycosyltransferase family 2 protein [Candidatus Competibacter sp.]